MAGNLPPLWIITEMKRSTVFCHRYCWKLFSCAQSWSSSNALHAVIHGRPPQIRSSAATQELGAWRNSGWCGKDKVLWILLLYCDWCLLCAHNMLCWGRREGVRGEHLSLSLLGRSAFLSQRNVSPWQVSILRAWCILARWRTPWFWSISFLVPESLCITVCVSSSVESSGEVMDLHIETSVERKKCGTNSSWAQVLQFQRASSSQSQLYGAIPLNSAKWCHVQPTTEASGGRVVLWEQLWKELGRDRCAATSGRCCKKPSSCFHVMNQFATSLC